MTFQLPDPGPPVLDLGDGVGALLVQLPDLPPTGELHAEPVGRPEGRFHTGVHLRPMGGHMRPYALFPEVAEGSYVILGDNGEPVASVMVTSGAVAQLEL